MSRTRRCPSCWMRHEERPFLAIPFCAICRDQVRDFLIVSVVMGVAWWFARDQLWLFIAQEIALVVLLIFVRHKVHPLWHRLVGARRGGRS